LRPLLGADVPAGLVHVSDLRQPGFYVTGTHGPGVEVPGRIAAWLESRLDFQRLRIAARGIDPEVDSVLTDFHRVALLWRSRVEALPCRGSEQAEPAEAGTPSTWVTTTEAAVRLGVTSSRVRQVIRAKHLVAEQVDHQWRITLQDLAHFVAARAA
jgi:excisionase family DNA binding protein